MKPITLFSHLILLLLLSSCNSQDLFPDLKIGESEENWKNYNQEGGLYKWNTEDTTLEGQIALNGDGITSGPLRIISLNLATTKVSATEANKFATAICPSSKFQRALLFLQKKLGKPDSVRYQTFDAGDGLDTALCKYYFHNNESTVLLETSKLFPPTSDILYPHFLDVNIYQISANYDNELSQVSESRRKVLRPKDIIMIPIYTKTSTEEKRLYLTASIDNPVTQFIALAEDRKIRSVKGRIVIKDSHGDSLLCYPDFTMNLQQPLQRAHSPGLQYATGHYGIFAEPYVETRRTVFIRMEHASVPYQLKSSFEIGSKIAASFIPESLLFTDGTVLKE